MKPTDLLDMNEEDDLRYWTSRDNNEWNNPTTSNMYGDKVKIVTLEDPALREKYDRLEKRNAKLQKEVSDLREFKKKATVLEKLLNEIKKNTSSNSIARLVRRIGIGGHIHN